MLPIKISCEVWLVILGALLSILIRCCTSLHPYSGEAHPPMYGDYEAQRHWMEITTNLPIDQWYQHTEHNNLTYWGLDYPPLTAYHMYLCGKIAALINPDFVALHRSHGHESPQHKLFMRYTVLAADLALFIPALVLFYASTAHTGKISEKPLSWSLSTVLGLLYPGIILIDHGHFQYNCVSLAFLVMATTALLKKQNLIASVSFCLALNYKQMELYHALPFFMYLLSTCVPKPAQSTISGILRLGKIGTSVIFTFAVVWAPFLVTNSHLHVLHRLFPVARGVFEDKVSNVWCFVNIFYKLRLHFNNYEMMRVCLFATISAVFPSCIDLFLRPNLKKFVLSLINSSLAFYLFSFQVHEKSILLVAVPVLMHLPQQPFVCFWFLCLSVFSMLPLLIKEGLVLATFSLMLFYVITFRVSIEHFYRMALNSSDGWREYYRSLLHALLNIEYHKAAQMDLWRITYKNLVKNRENLLRLAVHLFMVVSLWGCVVLTVAMLVFEPPERYPDLFPLLISVYSALHFLGFFVYFNYEQIRLPQQFDDYIKNVKIKSG